MAIYMRGDEPNQQTTTSPPMIVQFSDEKKSMVIKPHYLPYAQTAESVDKTKAKSEILQSTLVDVLQSFGIGESAAKKTAADIQNKKPLNPDLFEVQLIRTLMPDLYEHYPNGFHIIGTASEEDPLQGELNLEIARTRAQAAQDAFVRLFGVANILVDDSYFNLETKVLTPDPDLMYRFLKGEEVQLEDKRIVSLPSNFNPVLKDRMLQALDAIFDWDASKNKYVVRDDKKSEYAQFIQDYKIDNPFLQCLRGVQFELALSQQLQLSVSAPQSLYSTGKELDVPFKIELLVNHKPIDMTSSESAQRTAVIAELLDKDGKPVATLPIGRPSSRGGFAFLNFMPPPGEYTLSIRAQYLDADGQPILETAPTQITVRYAPPLEPSKISPPPPFKYTAPAPDLQLMAPIEKPITPVILPPVAPAMGVFGNQLIFERAIPSLQTLGGYSIHPVSGVSDGQFQSNWAEAYYSYATGAGLEPNMAGLWDVSNMKLDYFKAGSGTDLASLKDRFRSKLASNDLGGARDMLNNDLRGLLNEMVNNSKLVLRSEMVLFDISFDWQNPAAAQALYRNLQQLPDKNKRFLMFNGLSLDARAVTSAERTYSAKNGQISHTDFLKPKDDYSIGGSLLLNFADLPLIFGAGITGGFQNPSKSYSLDLQSYTTPVLPIYLRQGTLSLSPVSKPSYHLQVNSDEIGYSFGRRYLGVYTSYLNTNGQQNGLLYLVGKIEGEELQVRADLSTIFGPANSAGGIVKGMGLDLQLMVVGDNPAGKNLNIFLSPTIFFHKSAYPSPIKLDDRNLYPFSIRAGVNLIL